MKTFHENKKLNELYKQLHSWQHELQYNRNGLRPVALANIKEIRYKIKCELAKVKGN